MRLSLDSRMKKYEKINDFHFKPTKNNKDAEDGIFIIRLDGSCFSKRVKDWKITKPFNNDFHYAMVDTCKELINLIPDAKFIWTGSDEISIVCKYHTVNPWFNNRINKIVSLASSYTTYYFNKYMTESGFDISNYPAFFDARVIAMPDISEAANNILSRYNNCKKNSISMWAETVYTQKELLNKNSDKKIKMMKDKGLDWNNSEYVYDWTKYGTVIYKDSVCFDKENNKEVTTGDMAVELFKQYPEKYYIRNKSRYYDLNNTHDVLTNLDMFTNYFK